MNLEPFFTLFLSQTPLVHRKQATGVENNFRVKFVAIPSRDDKSNRALTGMI